MRPAAIALLLLASCNLEAPDQPADIAEVEETLPVEDYHVASEGDLQGPFTNRMAKETSPYLLQHKNNPVDWYPWGDEAFVEAKRRGVPIFMSIGYAACHWCHVMEEESFEDPEIAAYMNAHFVNIKVDREERPDVDGVYMKAIHAMRGSGGWPANLWLNHDRKPFYAGTYFPKETRLNRPGFREILAQMHTRWTDDPRGVEADATNVINGVRRKAFIAPSGDIDWDAPKKGIVWLDRGWDTENAGWGSKKFPNLAKVEFLLAYAVEHESEHAATRVRQILDAMDRGGIHDHIGGGMHRYTVDPKWVVPHFEKMLYDNGQFLRIYAEAAIALDEPRYGDVARGVADYLIRDMLAPGGAFYSSQDADSGGEEGTFYVWTPAQVRKAIPGPQAKAVIEAYNVTERGNFEKRTTILTRRPDVDAADPVLKEARATLRRVREDRLHPPTDTKRVVAYNGLTIGGLASAGRLLGEPEYIRAAAAAADAVLSARNADGSLPRTLEPGSPSGVIDDYAWFAEGLLDLYEADHNPKWLIEANAIAAVMSERFWDPVYGGYYYSEESKGLLVRQKEYPDGARPSGAGRGIAVLKRLRALGAPAGDGEKIQLGLLGASRYLGRTPGSVPTLLVVVDGFARSSMEVVIVTPPGQSAAAAPFVAKYNAAFRPHSVLAVVDAANAEKVSSFGALDGKLSGEEGAQAYVCFDGICKQPTTDVGTFVKLMVQE